MAIYYKNFHNEEPFDFRGRAVWLNGAPQNSPNSQSNTHEAIAARKEAMEDILRDSAKVSAELGETISKNLKSVYERPEVWAVFMGGDEKKGENLNRLIEAAVILQAAYEKRGINPKAYARTKAAFEKAFEDNDTVISPEEVKAIALAREQTEKKVTLLEAKHSKNLDVLKKIAYVFLTDREGDPIFKPEKLASGFFKVNFLGNEFARKYIGLAHLGEWISGNTVDVTKPDGTRRTVRRGPSGNFNEDKEGKPLKYGDPDYVEILDGYDVRAYRNAVSGTATADETAGVDSDDEPDVPSAVVQYLAASQPHGDAGPDARPPRRGEERTRAEAAALMAASTDKMPSAVAAEIETTRVTGEWKSNLGGKSAELHEDFKGEDSYEHIEKLAVEGTVAGGKEIYNAINIMRIIRNQVMHSNIDNRNMWNVLRKGFILNPTKGETKFIMTFDEMAKAVYGRSTNGDKLLQLHDDLTSEGEDLNKRYNRKKKQLAKAEAALKKADTPAQERLQTKVAQLKNEVKNLEDLAMLEKFFEAAEALMKYLPEAKETGASTDRYRQLREQEISELLKNQDAKEGKGQAAIFTNKFFEYDSYGTPVKFGVFETIVRKVLKKDERPIITQDTWMSRPGRQNYEVYGEREFISHARAFDEVMESDDYLETLNKYLKLGKDAMLGLDRFDMLGITGLSKSEVESIREISSEEADDRSFQPTEAQIAAVRHGAMINAAKEVKMYQDMKESAAEAESTETSPAVDMAADAAADAEGLDDDQREELKRGASKVAFNTLAGLAEFHGVTFTDVKAKLEHTQPIGQTNFALDLSGLAGLFERSPDGEDLMWAPRIINVKTGVSYEGKRVGVKKRGQFGADAHIAYRPGDAYEGDRWMPSVGVWAKMDIKEDGVWAAKASVQASLEAISGSLGMAKDFNRFLTKKVDKFKEDSETKQTVNEWQAQAETMIDNMDDVSDGEKAALKKAYATYIDELIETSILDATMMSQCLPVMEYGVSASVSVTKDKNTGKRGWGWGPYIVVGLIFPIAKEERKGKFLRKIQDLRKEKRRSLIRTFYVPPPVDIDEIYSPSTGERTPVTPPPGTPITVEFPEEFLYYGDDDRRTSAIAAANTKYGEAVGSLNKGLKDVELTAGEKFLNMELRGVSGTTKMYVDPDADVEIVMKTNGGIGLRLDTEDKPDIRVTRRPSSHGGQDETVVVVTTQKGASNEDILAKTDAYLSWDQYGGARSGYELIGSSDKFVEETAEMKAGSFSRKGMLKRVRSVETVDNYVKAEAQAMFDELPKNESGMAETVAQQLKDAGIDYRDLATSGHNVEINEKIVELYKKAGLTHKATFDNIYLARQYAMQLDRPDNPTSAKWNIDAIQSLAGESASLLVEDLQDYMKDYIEGRYKEVLLEGSEFFLFINEDGDKKLLHGYYDKDVHGQLAGVTKWDPLNPENTLKKLRYNLDNLSGEKKQSFKKTVKDFSAFIQGMDWPKPPFDSETEATLLKTAYTIPGELLLSEADAIFGEGSQEKLQRMILSGNTGEDSELAAQYAKTIYELYKNTDHTTMVNGSIVKLETEVYSGLYDKCMNLVLGRSFVLEHGKPTVNSTAVSVAHSEAEEGEMMTTEQGVSMPTVRVHPGIPSWGQITGVPDNASKDTKVDQGTGPKPTDVETIRPEIHLGQQDSEPGAIQK